MNSIPHSTQENSLMNLRDNVTTREFIPAENFRAMEFNRGLNATALVRADNTVFYAVGGVGSLLKDRNEDMPLRVPTDKLTEDFKLTISNLAFQDKYGVPASDFDQDTAILDTPSIAYAAEKIEELLRDSRVQDVSVDLKSGTVGYRMVLPDRKEPMRKNLIGETIRSKLRDLRGLFLKALNSEEKNELNRFAEQ